jgi:signal peptidase I
MTTVAPGEAPARGWRGRVVRAAGVLLVALLVASLVLLEPFTVRSSSMSPTLGPGDQVLAEKLTPHLWSLHRGDVVVFKPPQTGELMVKRVVALAGDRVGLADGRLVVNGHRVREPYVDLPSVDGVYFGPYAVPAGSIFVMGDDRAESVDSRTFGPVRESRVVGRVMLHLR